MLYRHTLLHPFHSMLEHNQWLFNTVLGINLIISNESASLSTCHQEATWEIMLQCCSYFDTNFSISLSCRYDVLAGDNVTLNSGEFGVKDGGVYTMVVRPNLDTHKVCLTLNCLSIPVVLAGCNIGQIHMLQSVTEMVGNTKQSPHCLKNCNRA